MNNNWPVGR